jgi:hypothetical protein
VACTSKSARDSTQAMSGNQLSTLAISCFV